jgi:hypothetical protein
MSDKSDRMPGEDYDAAYSEDVPEKPSAEQERACACCGKPITPRDPDPWDGRLDAYCEDCAHTRCDAYPGSCRSDPASTEHPEKRSYSECSACGRKDDPRRTTCLHCGGQMQVFTEHPERRRRTLWRWLGEDDDGEWHPSGPWKLGEPPQDQIDTTHGRYRAERITVEEVPSGEAKDAG